MARSLWFALLAGALFACDEGFTVVVDGGAAATDAAGDGQAPRDQAVERRDGLGDGSPPAPDGTCVALKRALGPVNLGFGEASSLDGALAATASRIAAVWETVAYSEGTTHLAIAEPDGHIAVKAQDLDRSDYAPSPAIAAIGDGFAVLNIHDAANPALIYRRIDESGTTQKMTQLATNPGGYLSAPAIASGPAGTVVAYTRHPADKSGKVYLAKIDPDGAFVKSFAPVATGTEESWHPALLATSAGFVVAWTETRPGDCAAVVVARLDSDLEQVAAPTVIADGSGCYQRPALAQRGDDGRELFVCSEFHAPGEDGSIACRALVEDKLGPQTLTSVISLSSRKPRIAAGGGGYAVLWTALAQGLEEIHSRLFTASGAPAGADQRISEDGVRSFYPAVVWTGDAFFATWYRYVPITVYYAAFRLSCTDQP